MLNKKQYSIGETIVFTAGFNDTYHVVGVYKALKQFDIERLNSELGNSQLASILSYQSWSSTADKVDLFIQWLLKEQYVEKIDHLLLHLGNDAYNCIEMDDKED